jgi:predicted membrane channel-forming protein YqfA (hemolysin III family)
MKIAIVLGALTCIVGIILSLVFAVINKNMNLVMSAILFALSLTFILSLTLERFHICFSKKKRQQIISEYNKYR